MTGAGRHGSWLMKKQLSNKANLEMEEVRSATRRKVLKAGSIVLAKGGVIGCAIRNLSTTGASVEVTPPMGIPDEFSLMIEMEHRKRPCKIVWRKDNRIGVAFV